MRYTKNTKLAILRITKRLNEKQMAKVLSMPTRAYTEIEYGRVEGRIYFWARVQRMFGLKDEEMWEYIKSGKEDEIENGDYKFQRVTSKIERKQ